MSSSPLEAALARRGRSQVPHNTARTGLTVVQCPHSHEENERLEEEKRNEGPMSAMVFVYCASSPPCFEPGSSSLWFDCADHRAVVVTPVRVRMEQSVTVQAQLLNARAAVGGDGGRTTDGTGV